MCIRLCLVLFFANSVLSKSLKPNQTEEISTETSVIKVVATTVSSESTKKALARYEPEFDNYGDDELENSNSKRDRKGRGMMVYDLPPDHDHDHPPPMQEQKAVKADPWAGYYDFVINEGSFKFWAVFQLGTALLLTYSAFAAIYYAKFNPLTTDYDYYDDFFFKRSFEGRSDSSATPDASSSSWFTLSPQTVQRILDAITSKKYS